jgi:hypothetical protein
LGIGFCRRSLGLVLGVYGALCHVGHGLFFFVAGNKRDRKKQCKAQNSADLKALHHPSRITAARELSAASFCRSYRRVVPLFAWQLLLLFSDFAEPPHQINSSPS